MVEVRNLLGVKGWKRMGVLTSAAALASAICATDAWARHGGGGGGHGGAHAGRSGGAHAFFRSAAAGASARVGGFHHHPHFHHFVGGAVFIGAPFWWYSEPPYFYGPDYSMPQYEPPTVYVEKFDGQPTPRTQGEIFCPSAGAYYPTAKQCPGGWQRVIRPEIDSQG